MISINNLTKSYKKNIIFDNVNILIPGNKIIFLMGENGSGKTTLFKCLLNLEDYNGEILYDGKSLDKVRNEVYVIYDDSPFYLNLNGYRNIELLLNKNIGIEEIKQIASMFLKHEVLKLKVKNYSYGQRKKLSLIIALLLKPKYLLMDEVSNGLDYDTMLLLKNIIQEWSKKMTIIMTGHQFEFYDDIIEELFILKEHSIIKVNNFKESGDDLGAVYKEYIK
ncbi:MAG: ABC transporter ATP-binding protein [Thermoanaerobacteraceae bacterium]|nr:ABC transporter ATP-binding protein [Thermoanaerobacteraceae bacterium]